ncbi:protein BASIC PENTACYSTEINE2-like [Impatiens glandulifera]|uniref:protein BASIC PENTACYSTEINE2-like n=1 Tax=Impatiens glandulifera TaxID=253017 RepID=UPI001FB155BA|nr:protein BASIC PENTACYSTEINE2-like [Impatiens glandulifera]
MEDDGLNMQNWGYYEPSNFKSHLGLQLMPTVSEQNVKPFFTTGRDHHPVPHPVPHPHPHHQHHHNPNAFMMMGNNNNNSTNNGGFQSRDCAVSEPPNLQHMDYLRESWLNQQRDKFINVLPINPNFNVLPEPGLTHPMHQILPPPETLEDPNGVGNEVVGTLKKRNCNSSSSSNPKGPKPKKSKKGPSVMPKENGNSSSSVQRAKQPKKSMDMNMLINGMNMDISTIPIPVCSCTGAVQQCYRWGCGGWQSACCTTTISTYPLPMSTKRRGARIAGRKMSQGAFKKVLEKLASECYNFNNPIDLRNHWAKHGTNKFVTIR